MVLLQATFYETTNVQPRPSEDVSLIVSRNMRNSAYLHFAEWFRYFLLFSVIKFC